MIESDHSLQIMEVLLEAKKAIDVYKLLHEAFFAVYLCNLLQILSCTLNNRMDDSSKLYHFCLQTYPEK